MSKFINKSNEQFWNELFALEKSGNLSILLKEINKYYEEYFLFKDIQNELTKYKEYVLNLPLKIKQQNILKILNDIKNSTFLGLINWKDSEEDVKVMYIDLITSMIRNPQVNSTKRYVLFKSLELNNVDIKIETEGFILKTFETDFLNSPSFLKKSKKIEDALSKYISVNDIAQQLLLQEHLNNFPNSEKINEKSIKTIINKACKLLNIKDINI
ncbi:hypothetical protein [Mycoplasma phocimorsus]|uniref:hypothetical protein n=1 Tax=Mycoplasma phocimorsus TaxID=3045839 RepID=UPI0024BFBA75|nr:hypothetical protein [Mycoplasma phocimorsus]MDJ1646318.1 hypothetical protein [Mycoplasma phocimorsus]MDJ1647241.1 hypothetical protein [Mycoplasma phocimorsus]MDJ1647889.1 hypothetical protein [Mycoplasma phocimorsus]MDJ1649039.1 hypothetical protein [Mycoplasma phocimorsus]